MVSATSRTLKREISELFPQGFIYLCGTRGCILLDRFASWKELGWAAGFDGRIEK